MGFINFNKARPIDVDRYGTNLYYRHDGKWLCLATNCKHLIGFGSYNGFKYVDSDEYLHHFYDEFKNSDVAYYEKHESYEQVMDQRTSVCYLVTEDAILKYSEELYKEFPAVKEELDRLNDDSKLRSDNPYIKKRVG